MVILSHDESGRVGREINCKDEMVILVREDFFECLCVPNRQIAVDCPRCDPSAILRDTKTPDIPCCHCCHWFAVFYSPHSKSLGTTSDDIVAIRCKFHCLYFATDVDFDERGTVFSTVQHQCNCISPVRTGHRRGHQRRGAVVKVNEQAVFFVYPLPYIDIDRCTRSITSCFRRV